MKLLTLYLSWIFEEKHRHIQDASISLELLETHVIFHFSLEILFRTLRPERSLHTQNGSDQTCYQIGQLLPPLLSGKPVGVGLLLAQ